MTFLIFYLKKVIIRFYTLKKYIENTMEIEKKQGLGYRRDLISVRISSLHLWMLGG